jgi:hypothetical protein
MNDFVEKLESGEVRLLKASLVGEGNPISLTQRASLSNPNDQVPPTPEHPPIIQYVATATSRLSLVVSCLST